MWIAKFKLKDEEDIYSPLCEKYKVEWFAIPHTNFEKNRKINLLVCGILSGSKDNKTRFVEELKKDKRIRNIEQHHDFILVHAQHPLAREIRAEIKIFYNPQYILVRPVHVASDGWEYWEVACLDKKELIKITSAARRHYHGKLFSLKQEKLKSISSLEITPDLTERQIYAIKMALDNGYYKYPRKLTIPDLSKIAKISYSTFQEHLRKGENKLITYFLKYR